MSGLKRTTGSALCTRTEKSLFTEAGLRVLAKALRCYSTLDRNVFCFK